MPTTRRPAAPDAAPADPVAIVRARADALYRAAIECCRQHDRAAKLFGNSDPELEHKHADALCAMCDGSLAELSHAYDSQRGEWANAESLEDAGFGDRVEPDDHYRQTHPDGTEEVDPIPEINSVGIDLDGDGDRDVLDGHPDWFTENEIRDEMGIPNRDVY